MFQAQHPVGIKKARRTANVGHAFLKHAPIIYPISETCKKKFFTSYSQFQCAKFFDEKTCQDSAAFDSAQVANFSEYYKIRTKADRHFTQNSPLGQAPNAHYSRLCQGRHRGINEKNCTFLNLFRNFKCPTYEKIFFRPRRKKAVFQQ